MHDSARFVGKQFFETYCSRLGRITVAEIGSQNVNGSLRDYKTENVIEYVGIDFASGNGVDVVLKKPYEYPFESDTFDVVVTSSCFEHSEFFWLAFEESLRILKPTGVLYCNAPAQWPYHAYPVDCWRFFPDAGQALENWGKHKGIPVKLLETFNYRSNNNNWELFDWTAVYAKNKAHANLHPNRILDVLGEDKNTKETIMSEDGKRLLHSKIFRS
jgi:SAM-dependent methyltransferase